MRSYDVSLTSKHAVAFIDQAAPNEFKLSRDSSLKCANVGKNFKPEQQQRNVRLRCRKPLRHLRTATNSRSRLWNWTRWWKHRCCARLAVGSVASWRALRPWIRPPEGQPKPLKTRRPLFPQPEAWDRWNRANKAKSHQQRTASEQEVDWHYSWSSLTRKRRTHLKCKQMVCLSFA